MTGRALLVGALAVVVCVGCGTDQAASSARPTSTSTIAASSTLAGVAPSSVPTATPAVPAAADQGESCRDVLDWVTALRETAGADFDPAATAEEILSGLREAPEWAGMTAAQRDAVTRGVRQAATTGHC